MAVDEKALEIVAESLWQADSERAAGRRRMTEWADESDSTHEAWRFMARAAILAYEAAKAGTDHIVDANKMVQAPAGWKLAPKEPTTKMLAAGQTAWLADPCRKSSTLYRAMLAAAPTPPGAKE